MIIMDRQMQTQSEFQLFKDFLSDKTPFKVKNKNKKNPQINVTFKKTTHPTFRTNNNKK